LDSIDIIDKSNKINNESNDEIENKLKELDERLILEMIYEQDLEFDSQEEDKIVEEIIELSEKSGKSIDFDAEEMFKAFNENYRPRALKNNENDTKENDVIKITENSKLKDKPKKKRGKIFKIFTALAASIAIFCISTFFVGGTTAFASPEIFDMWISFTEEVFKINYERKGSNAEKIENGAEVDGGKRYFQDYSYVEKKYGVCLQKPGYIPKGYKLDKVYVISDKDNLKLCRLIGNYSDGEKNLKYTIENISQALNSNINIEKNKEAVKCETINDNTVYIFENNNWMIAVWQDMDMSYSISGNVSYNEMVKIIKSLKY